VREKTGNHHPGRAFSLLLEGGGLIFLKGKEEKNNGERKGFDSTSALKPPKGGRQFRSVADEGPATPL